MNWSLIFGNAIYTAIGVQAIGFCLAAIGINVHFGYTGLLNFGQAGFVAVGAWCVAVPISRYHWNFWATIPLLLVAATILALLLGIPTLRLRADYLAIVTIAAAEIIRFILNSVRFTWLLGGNDGLQNFTGDFARFGDQFIPNDKRFSILGQPFTGYNLFVIIVGWLVVGAMSLFVYLLMRSPWGRVLKSIREDEDAPRSLGKNIFAYKMQSLVIGGIIGALGGAIMVLGIQAAQPNSYGTPFTFFAWTILILGGVGRVKGPIIGSLIFWFLITFSEGLLAGATANNYLPDWLVNENNFGQWRFMLTGLALALLVIFRPQGIFGDRREQAFDVR
jgi:neutral amino acid transport system permease protein